MINETRLNSQFRKIGTTFKLREVGPRTFPPRGGFRLDVKTPKGKKEYFDFLQHEAVNVAATDVQPDLKHLLLTVQTNEETLKFLCGHDERHYFASGVPVGVTSVQGAMEALMPDKVRVAASQMPATQRFERHNEVYKRQGEWFFVPVKRENMRDFRDELVLRGEPIRRGRSKAHYVQYLYRVGGKMVWRHLHYPNGVTEEVMRDIISGAKAHSGKDTARNARLQTGWSRMSVDMRAFGKGWVKHPDHATLILRGWHEILMNQEVAAESMAFLD